MFEFERDIGVDVSDLLWFHELPIDVVVDQLVEVAEWFENPGVEGGRNGSLDTTQALEDEGYRPGWMGGRAWLKRCMVFF